MLLTRLWRCELRRFVSAAGWRACARLFAGVARRPSLSLFYCCVVSFALSRRLCFFLFARVSSSYCPRVCPLFASVLSCLRYFVVVNGGLCPFIFQGFLLS